MKNRKILKVATIIVMLFIIFTGTVNATITPGDYKPKNLTVNDYQQPFKFAGTIMNAIVIVGVVISITMTMVLGIKYMIGSVEERAEYKKTMGPMFIGMIMLFTISTVVGIIYNIVSSI